MAAADDQPGCCTSGRCHKVTNPIGPYECDNHFTQSPSLNVFYGPFYQMDMGDKFQALTQALVVNMKTQLSSHLLYAKYRLKADSPPRHV